MKQNLLDLDPPRARAALEAFCASEGIPPYRARQVLRRLWQAPVRTFQEMVELPKTLRERLDQVFEMPPLELIHAANIGWMGRRSFSFACATVRGAIETVAIPEGRRLTLCISSQAGCALKCAFCATGAMGFSRNLEPCEIAGQVRELRLLDPPLVATNIVFMGMGEPLMNWRAVDPTLTILNDPDGFGIGARHITVSTVGGAPWHCRAQ